MALDASSSRNNRNSFAEALSAETAAGNESLSVWIGQVQARGALESLFELETWLKGIHSFFNLEHLQLTDAEKAGLVSRSFAPEIGIVRRAVQLCEKHACEVLDPRTGGNGEFEDFVEARMRQDRMMDYSISRMAGQLTPADSVAQLVESLNDLRVTIDSLKVQPGREFQLFLALGRSFSREIRNCRYVDMLMSQRFRLQHDSVDNNALTASLGRLPQGPVRHRIALVFLYLFRFLKYLKLVQADLNRDQPLKQHLIIFSLLHEETAGFLDFLKTRLLRDREVADSLQNAAELIAYSLKMESQRVHTHELVLVSREADPRIVYSKIENSHGLLRDCYQSCILTLAQSMDKSFDPAVLFPFRAGHLMASEKLRQDLWELRRWLMDVLANSEELDSNRIIERVGRFKDASLRSLMYRDWAEFETFSDSLAVSIDAMETRTHIRKFVSYLESLIQQVSKRRVFQEEPQNSWPELPVQG